jgi:hypothetical protein
MSIEKQCHLNPDCDLPDGHDRAGGSYGTTCLVAPSIFDGLEGVGAREPVRRERTLAYGACPHCSAEKVGLVRSPDSRHLVWRAHNLTTWARTSLPCQATAQRLCDAPARHIVGYDVPYCSHTKGRL